MVIYLAYILIDLAYVHAAQNYAVCHLVVYQKHTLEAAWIQPLVFVSLLQDFVLCIPPQHKFGVQYDRILFSVVLFIRSPRYSRAKTLLRRMILLS